MWQPIESKKYKNTTHIEYIYFFDRNRSLNYSVLNSLKDNRWMFNGIQLEKFAVIAKDFFKLWLFMLWNISVLSKFCISGMNIVMTFNFVT